MALQISASEALEMGQIYGSVLAAFSKGEKVLVRPIDSTSNTPWMRKNHTTDFDFEAKEYKVKATPAADTTASPATATTS